MAPTSSPFKALPLLQLLLIARSMAFTEIGLVTKLGPKPGLGWVPAWVDPDFRGGRTWKLPEQLFPGQQVCCSQLMPSFHLVWIGEWVKIWERVGAFEWQEEQTGIGDSLVSQGKARQGQLGRDQECQCLQGGSRVSDSPGRVGHWRSRCGCSVDQVDQPEIQSVKMKYILLSWTRRRKPTKKTNWDENEPRPTVPERVREGEAAKGNSETCLGFEKRKNKKSLFFRKTRR